MAHVELCAGDCDADGEVGAGDSRVPTAEEFGHPGRQEDGREGGGGSIHRRLG